MFETYTKRVKKLASAGKSDVYQYEILPDAFRVQVVHIWRDAIGVWMLNPYGGYQPDRVHTVAGWWKDIRDIIAREWGQFFLFNQHSNAYEDCVSCFLGTETNRALDLIEFSMRWIDRIVRDRPDLVKMSANDAIAELNHRFREHGIGFQYLGGVLSRLDSEYLHAEVVVPAVRLLHSAGFAGASDEFLRAHEHYRKGRLKEAITEALKAFESTMKQIAIRLNWTLSDNATASKLIEAVFVNELIPSSLSSHFTALQQVMTSGLPTVRNRNSGHGQGETTVEVPDHLAGYALHLAAANIVFLVNAFTGKK